MKRKLLILALAVIGAGIATTARAALSAGTEYYIWLNIYEKLLGSNEAGDGPALSAFGTNTDADSYVFVAEDAGKSGYVLLRQKSSGKYLAASGSNAWSIVFEGSRSTDDRFCWAADAGTYAYLVSKKNSKYVGIDGGVKGADYVSIYYDKVRGSHSQFTIIPTGGGDYDAAREAYESAVYTNAQGVSEIDYVRLNGKTVSRSDAVDIHLTANEDPIGTGASVNLGSDRTWLIFDNVTPSDVIEKYLQNVKINGSTAADGSNCRVAIYLNGAAVIPTPSTIFSASGERSFTLDAGSHTDLAENSNTMTSFTLRRGYMATLASGTNGGGHSRVYVADHADLSVTLPTALARRVSSVYVKPWQYVSKKGWGDTGGATNGPKLRATWYWAWNASYWSTKDMEYVPCRQHRYWPSASEVNGHTSTAAFSINEPEHSEQHTADKCSCGGTLNEWTTYGFTKDFQAGGGRIGSPQPTALSFLTKYFKYVDENDNRTRCDFAVTHSYWDLGGRDAASYADWFCNTECKGIWNNTGRPVWLTEMEISASWNSNKPSNYEQSRQYLQALLQKIDECPWIERYAIYSFDSWVNYMFYDCNPSKGFTPAGQVYRDHRATFAYNAAYTKEPVWWNPSAQKPALSATYDAASGTAAFTISNPNTDFTDQLRVEMSADGASWTQVATVADRSQLENSTFVLDDVAIASVAAGTKFRVSITTLAGGSATSDIFEIGALVNGSVNATSFSEVYGWTCTRGANNGYTKAETGDTYFEVWHPTSDGMSFDYYQELSGLQNGVYRLQAKVFNSSNGVAGASVNGAVGLYAQCAGTTWFAPATADSEIDGAATLSLTDVVVTNGTLRVGVRNLKAMTARWAGADDFVLTYLGTTENILGKSDDEAIASARKAFLQLMPAEGTSSRDFSYFIHNPEATASTQGWTTTNVDMTSGESYNNKDSDPKNTYFDRWAGSAYTSTLKQTVPNLPPGTYVLSAILRGSASTMSLKLEAQAGSSVAQQSLTGTGNTGDLGAKGWHEVKLDPITLAEGDKLDITLTATGESWWSADHFRLIYTPEETDEPEPQPAELAFSSETATATVGDEFTAPALDNPHQLTVTWTSSDENVATVDAEGNVTILAAGTTTIAAAFEGSDDFQAATVSYILTVEEAEPQPEPQPAELAFSSETATATVGDEFTSPTLDNPHQLAVTWTSSDENVATVDAEGNVTILAAGTTTIAAAFEGSDDFQAATVSYILTVEEAEPQPEPQPAELAFSSETAAATVGDEFTSPTLDNPHQLTVTWTSSDENVATVDAEGNVTILAAGTTTITAAFEGNDDFLAATVSYELVVSEPDAVRGIAFARRGTVYSITGSCLGQYDLRTLTDAHQHRLLPGIYIVEGRKMIIR